MPATISRDRHESATGFLARGVAPKLLFVEDDRDVLETYRTRLRKFDVDVLSAPSGREGLSLARETEPDIVITDVCMARGDGDYLVGKLKRRSRTSRIPIIVISGMDDPALALRMYQSGVNRFLRKPVPFDQLVREIGKYVSIERRRTLAEPVPEEEPRYTPSWASGRRFRLDGIHARPRRTGNRSNP